MKTKGGVFLNYMITAVIQQEENWYVAKCLENEIASQGKTLDEALNNLKEALELFYEDSSDETLIFRVDVASPLR